MNVEDILLNGGGCLVMILTLVQISPIKVNPWSAIARWLGRAINGDVIEDLAEVKNQLAELKERDAKQDAEREESKALDARRRILQFGDEVRRKVRHSEEHFNNLFDDISFYKNYCQSHPNFENDKAVVSIALIEETYTKCFRENDFL